MPDQNEHRPEGAGRGGARRPDAEREGGTRDGGHSGRGHGSDRGRDGRDKGARADGGRSGRSFGHGRDAGRPRFGERRSPERDRPRDGGRPHGGFGPDRDADRGNRAHGGAGPDRGSGPERGRSRPQGGVGSGRGGNRAQGRFDRERGDRPSRERDTRAGARPDRDRGRGPAGARPDSGRPRGGRAHAGEKRFDASPARRAALQVGGLLRERDAFAQDLIAKHIDGSRMSREDRAFATRLVLGVVSARGTLDEVIDRSMRSPDDVRDDVRDALRIGVYEIYFLDKSPHAAVDQCVELVRTFEPRACGLANAVLRKAVALKEEFPFGDPQRDLEAFARQHAFPAWLAKRLIADVGHDAAREFMEASNEPAPLFVAVNAARAADEEVRAELEAAHGDPEPVELDGRPLPGCYRVSSGRVLQDGRIRRLLGQGKLFVSDAASQEVARLVLPENLPQSLLEVGAGRATKTLLLQSGALRAWGQQIPGYVTVDNHEFKTRLLRERTEAHGIQVAEACTADATKLDAAFPGRLFDVVFVDAPCSGLGTLRRHPEIRWRLKEDAIDEMADRGLALLKSAAAHVAPGGTLAYATCTVTHAENNGVVMRFLESPEGAAFSLAPLEGKGCFATRLRPGSPDAHFAVKMVRAADAGAGPDQRRQNS